MIYRAGYALRVRSGQLRRQLPISDWSARPLRGFLKDPNLAQPDAYAGYRRLRAPAFFFRPEDRARYCPYLAPWQNGASTPQFIVSELAKGRLRCFGHSDVAVGFPPDWHANVFTGERAPADRHWSEISDFDYGDIKGIWEASRFSFTYALVRAYWQTGDEYNARLFWQLFEDWRNSNPPQQGPNWKCGQETSFRVMAWCFGLYGFLDAQETTPERVEALAQAVAVSGERISANLNRALSQDNNHGISEAMGLWTIGLLFPEFRDAERWREMGRRALEQQGRTLIYRDGGFSQHSTNYHRVMLQDYLWAFRLGDVNAQPLSHELRARLGRAGELLYQLQDEQTGYLPNYGHNDGALVLPLNNCDYRDFRPVIQATQTLATGQRCYPAGPWDEDLLWLFGPQVLDALVQRPQRLDLQASDSGYFAFRTAHGFAFTRCSAYRHRPGQADMLHVDIWWRGVNAAQDAGTYSYNAPVPWNNALGRTIFHNTVSVDDLDQMNQVEKFLWLPWMHGWVRGYHTSTGNRLAYWEGQHDGYQRLEPPVSHRRGLLRLGLEHWLVIDVLDSMGAHDYRLHWLCPDCEHTWNEAERKLVLQTAAGEYWIQVGVETDVVASSLVRADPNTPRGWRSVYYYDRDPALSMATTVRASRAVFWTHLGPEAARVIRSTGTWHVQAGDWEATLEWPGQPDGAGLLLAGVQLAGLSPDVLELSKCT